MRTKPLDDDPSEVGQDFFYGLSGKRNYRKAFRYLFEAANLGEIHAQNLVGYCYSRGLGVKKDKAQAFFWYQQAAKYHHKEALFNLGVLFDNGEESADPERGVPCIDVLRR
jgi:TPR repeat protein